MVGKLARVALLFLSIFGGRFRVFEEKLLPFLHLERVGYVS